MTDQTIPADKVRAILDEWERIKEHADWEDFDNLVQDVRALLPAAPRPTLADMYAEEWDECTGMQADLAQGDRVVILDGTPDHDGLVQVLEKSLDVYRPSPEDVTPRPDLPRMEWPGDKKPTPAPSPVLPEGWRLADHPQYGPVVVTSTEPDDGYVWFVRPDPYGGSEGYDAGCCKPDALTFLAQGADTSATEGGGTSDTVPEGTLAVGSVWDDADALTRACAGFWRDQIVVADKRGMVGVWDTGMQCWRVSAPHADFAPYTVIHAGKKADQ